MTDEIFPLLEKWYVINIYSDDEEETLIASYIFNHDDPIDESFAFMRELYELNGSYKVLVRHHSRFRKFF